MLEKLVSRAVDIDIESPPWAQRVFMNSGPVFGRACPYHSCWTVQGRDSPSGQGDWAVMKIPQEKSKGNSPLLFVMRKRRRQRQEGRETLMSEEAVESVESTQCECKCECQLRCSDVRYKYKLKRERGKQNVEKSQTHWVNSHLVSKTTIWNCRSFTGTLPTQAWVFMCKDMFLLYFCSSSTYFSVVSLCFATFCVPSCELLLTEGSLQYLYLNAIWQGTLWSFLQSPHTLTLNIQTTVNTLNTHACMQTQKKKFFGHE